MEAKSKYYTLYKFNDDTSYKVEVGKDGVTEVDMRKLRRVIKSQSKTQSRLDALHTVSLDAITSAGDKHLISFDDSVDVELIIEAADEINSLHKAINKLSPSQRALLQNVYFQNKQKVDIANELGITKQSIDDRLEKIYTRLAKYIK